MPGRTAVGLDIGTSGVRAAEVSIGKSPARLERFGQVALPFGAVRDGEVIDVDAVATAIRHLWSSSKFGTKKVAVGVANQKVIVRQVDLPWMPANELREALAFQVADYIPMPVDQVILDFHPLEEYEADNGSRLLRVLLVAASREMVHNTVAAVQQAGLKPVMVDLTPFAVLRSLAELDELGLMSEEAEALVDIGATVTNIVVHQGGVPRFVRILLMGGSDITDAVSDRLGLPVEEAEAIKQHMGMPVRPGMLETNEPAERIIETSGSAFVEEIRSSLDYFQAQPGAPRIGRVVLSGGGGRLRGLADRLAFATRLPVEPGSVLHRLEVGKVGLDPEQLEYVQPLSNVPVGLAMGMAS